jgi:hypothetical protein
MRTEVEPWPIRTGFVAHDFLVAARHEEHGTAAP